MIRELIRFTQWEVRVPVRFFLKKNKQKNTQSYLCIFYSYNFIQIVYDQIIS